MQVCPPHPGGAGSTAQQPAARSWVPETEGERIRSGRARPHNVAPGRLFPPPWGSPCLPRVSPLLLSPPLPPRPGWQASWAQGRTDPAGGASERASTRRPLPPPPPLPLPSRTRAAQGGRRGARRWRSEEGELAEDRPKREVAPAAAASPLLHPVPQTWRWQLRKEAPVLQRHSVLLTARLQQEETAAVRRGWVFTCQQPPKQSSRLALPLPLPLPQAAYPSP